MQQYLSLAQDESSINYLKGIAAMGLGKYDEAESEFQKVLASGDQSLSIKVYLNRVRNYFLAERYNEAVQAGEQYLSKLSPDKEKYLNYGFDAYITKPINDSVLFSCLEKFILSEKR